MKYKFRIKSSASAPFSEPTPPPAGKKTSGKGSAEHTGTYDETELLLQEILSGAAEGEGGARDGAVEDFDKVAFLPDEFDGAGEGPGTEERKIQFDETAGNVSPLEETPEEPEDGPLFGGAAEDGEDAFSEPDLPNFEGTVPLTPSEGSAAGAERNDDLGGATKEMDPLQPDEDAPFSDEDGFSDADEENGDEDENSENRKKIKSKSNKKKLILCILLPIVGVILLLFILIQILLAMGKFSLFGMNITGFDLFGVSPTVYSELTVEVGTQDFDVTDFVNRKYNPDGKHAELLSGVYDLHRLGTYALTISFEGKSYSVSLEVADTVAPTADVKCALVPVGAELTQADLVRSVEDETKVEIEVTKVDTSSAGVKPITLRFTDEAGNSNEYKTRVYVATSVNTVAYEIGSTFPAVSAFVTGIEGMSIDSAFTPASINVPGSYEIPLRCTIYAEDIINAKLEAADTVPPEVKVKSQIEMFSSNLPDPATLLESVTDATATTVAYKENYNFTEDGKYTITVVVTDAGGNKTEVDVEVFVYVTDITEAPLIIASDFTVEVGTQIDYKEYIRVLDSADGEIDVSDSTKITIDASAVDTSVPGSYTMKITARDSDGNTSEKTITVTVAHKAVTEDEVKTYVNGVLAGIVREGMTREEQLLAVYRYLTGEGALKSAAASDKSGEYYVEAYYGFTLGKGDDFTVCSMMRVMLDCLEIPYHVVERNGTRLGDHSWLLADFGDGWYHVDAFPHEYTWTKDTFKLTDAEMDSFTKWYDTKAKGWNYYGFDAALYPATPVLNADGSYSYTPYTVTYSAGSGGKVEGESFQKVDHGKTASKVKAVPEEGFTFRGWSDGVTEAEREDVILGNLNIVAEFTAESLPGKSYVLSYSAGEGGYVSGHSLQNVYEGYQGTAVTAMPAPGYLFKGWSDGVTTAERSDKASANLSVTALFEKDPFSFVLTYQPGPGGSISGRTTQVLAVGEQGSAVKAIPADGYVFLGWSDGVTSPERSDKANADLTVTAQFGRGSLTLRYLASEGGHIEGTAEQSVAAGAKGSKVTAVPEPGYLFTGWSDGVASAEREDTAGSTDLIVTANFEKDTRILRVQYIAGEGGSVRGKVIQDCTPGTTTEAVQAVPSAGYVFDHWSDGSTTSERSDLVTASVSYTAYFRRIGNFSVTFIAGIGGTIDGKDEQTVREGASAEPVTAVPSAGYSFVGWYIGGTLVSESPTITYTPTESCTLEAKFVKAFEYHFEAGEGGTLSGPESLTLRDGEKGGTVTASPKEGYTFEGWYAGDRLISSSESLTVTGGEYAGEGETAVTITARFAQA